MFYFEFGLWHTRFTSTRERERDGGEAETENVCDGGGGALPHQCPGTDATAASHNGGIVYVGPTPKSLRFQIARRQRFLHGQLEQ